MAHIDNKIPVLIVGAGVVGLSASLFLAQHGIKCTIVERRFGTSSIPRARSVNARTMELFRRLGIAERVREAGASIAPSAGILQGPTLREAVESRRRKQSQGRTPFADFMDTTSPENGTFVTQDMLEPVLLAQAGNRGVNIHFDTECTRVDQSKDHVVAHLRRRDTDAPYSIQADYLIAADGAKSPIRSQLNISTSGRGSFGNLLNILFQANLKELVQDREFSLCLVEQPSIAGIFTSINNDDRWVFHLHFDISRGEKAEDFTFDRCEHVLSKAIGIPGLQIDVKSVIPWDPSVKVAERVQDGRVFLVGDAAHQMPPYAGQGANTGIADAHNLAWKIAAVLEFQANEELLSTYEVERLPVGRAAAEISAIGCDSRGLPPVKKNMTFVNSIWQKIFIVAGLGYGYVSQAISTEDTGPLGGWSWRPWTVPSLFFAIDGRPGRRLPHIWIEWDKKTISTLDICGTHFVLLAGRDGAEWIRAARELNSSSAMKIDTYVVSINGDLKAPKGAFEAASGISSTGALLIRPDDFVVWRSRRCSKNCKVEIERAVQRALCLRQ